MSTPRKSVRIGMTISPPPIPTIDPRAPAAIEATNSIRKNSSTIIFDRVPPNIAYLNHGTAGTCDLAIKRFPSTTYTMRGSVAKIPLFLEHCLNGRDSGRVQAIRAQSGLEWLGEERD